MDANIKKNADKRHWRIFKRIHKQTCLNAAELQEYLDFLHELQNSRVYIPFFMICMKEMEMVKVKFYRKSLSQTYAESFSRITFIFGRSLLDMKFSSDLYSEIIEIWSKLLPDRKDAFKESFVNNEDVFQELFHQLPMLGHVIMQWDLIGILLKYTLYSPHYTDKLLRLTEGPAYSRVRRSFKKISSKIDQHSLEILKKINEDSTEKFVVSLTAIKGCYNGKHKINSIKFASVSQALVVYFNLGNPGISCFFDISTINENDTSEAIHVFDIALENIRKITLNKMPYDEIFVIKIKLKNIDRDGIKKLVFNFRNSQFEHMINSNVFEVLQIQRNDIKIGSAYTPNFKRSIANIDQREFRERNKTHSFETIAETKNQTPDDVFVNDSNGVSRVETFAERNQMFPVIIISDSEVSQDDHETDSEQKRKKQTNASQGIPLPPSSLNTCVQNSRKSDENSVLSVKSNQMDSPPIELNPQQVSQSDINLQLNALLASGAPDSLANPNENSKPTRRKLFDRKSYNESREMSPSTQSVQTICSQRDIGYVAAMQNSRKNDEDSVLSLKSNQVDSQPIELNSQQVPQSDINLPLNILSSSGAPHPALNPNENSKPTCRKLFDHKSYNESRKMSSSTQLVQNENYKNVSTDSFEIIVDRELYNSDIWNSQVLPQSIRQSCNHSSVYSQRDIDSVAAMQNSRKSDKNSVLSQKSNQMDSQPIELNPQQVPQSDINLQLNVLSLSDAPHSVVNPNENSKPTRRKLFDHKSYNESREMSSSTQSFQTNEDHVSKTINSNVKIDQKTVFFLTDDPFRVLDFNYSSDDSSNNLHSKRRPVNNATRFKSFRANSRRNTVAEYPKPAEMPILVPLTNKSTADFKKRSLNSNKINLPNPTKHGENSDSKMKTSISSNISTSRKHKISLQSSGKSIIKKAKYTQEQDTSKATVIQSLDYN